MTDWSRFDLQAIRGEAMAIADNRPPLEFGQYVAWTEHNDFGYTDGLSAKHMAGTNLVTICGQIMPAPIRQLAFVPKTLKLCGACAMKYARLRGGMSA